MEVRDAVDHLMSRHAVTLDMTLHASADEVETYLRRTAERTDDGAPTRRDAEVLAELELTAVTGDGQRDGRMNELERTDPVDGALSVGFGGKDAVGVKSVDGELFVRIGADTLAKDVLRRDEAGVARVERFMQRARQLPDPLEVARRALSGAWVRVEPHHYDQYARPLHEEGQVPASLAGGIADGLTESARLLEAQTQWDLVDDLAGALRSGARLEPRGAEGGAERVEVRMAAGRAEEALRPLADVLEQQSTRFGLPSLVQKPADPEAEVTAELELRNGVLSRVTFDLGQFGGADFPELPLRVDLTGGSAITLSPPPTEQVLRAEDLSVALLYLEVRERERREDTEQGNIPGPIQP